MNWNEQFCSKLYLKIIKLQQIKASILLAKNYLLVISITCFLYFLNDNLKSALFCVV